MKLRLEGSLLSFMSLAVDCIDEEFEYGSRGEGLVNLLN